MKFSILGCRLSRLGTGIAPLGWRTAPMENGVASLRCRTRFLGDRMAATEWTGKLRGNVVGPTSCGLRTADCGLRTADCGLRTADCGLRIVRVRAEEISPQLHKVGKVDSRDDSQANLFAEPVREFARSGDRAYRNAGIPEECCRLGALTRCWELLSPFQGFAPLAFEPTAHAVGYFLPPLRGCRVGSGFRGFHPRLSMVKPFGLLAGMGHTGHGPAVLLFLSACGFHAHWPISIATR